MAPIDKPKLTIAIPTWNRSTTLDKSLEYLLPQVAEYCTEIEVIISDNASDDDTEKVVSSYQNKFPSISLIYNKNSVNIGFFGNSKVCKELSKGEYMWLLSDDDFVNENVIANVITGLENYDDYAIVYLKNNLKLDKLSNKRCNKEETIENETFYMGLISAIIFFNNKDNDEFLYKKYPGAPFMGFLFLLNSFNFKEKALIIEGNCLLGAMEESKGFNYFDVFINGMNDVINYMKEINISETVIIRFRKSYLLKFILPGYVRFKIEKGLRFGKFEISNIKTINSWLFKSYSDLAFFWILFYPFMLLPPAFSKLALKVKQLLTN